MTEPTKLEGKRARTRMSLVNAARTLVMEHGHSKVSIQEITDRAGVGLGTFYNYFETKQMVFEAVLEEIRDRLENRLAEIRESISDPATALAASLEYCLNEAQDNEEWRLFLDRSGLEGEYLLLHDEVRCQEEIEQGRVRGRFKVDDAAFAAHLITGMSRHVTLEIARGHQPRDTIKETIRYVLRMLGLPDPVARAIIQAPLPPVAAPRKTRSQREILPHLEKVVN